MYTFLNLWSINLNDSFKLSGVFKKYPDIKKTKAYGTKKSIALYSQEKQRAYVRQSPKTPIPLAISKTSILSISRLIISIFFFEYAMYCHPQIVRARKN